VVGEVVLRRAEVREVPAAGDQVVAAPEVRVVPAARAAAKVGGAEGLAGAARPAALKDKEGREAKGAAGSRCPSLHKPLTVNRTSLNRATPN
jgi:hypothetical protein